MGRNQMGFIFRAVSGSASGEDSNGRPHRDRLGVPKWGGIKWATSPPPSRGPEVGKNKMLFVTLANFARRSCFRRGASPSLSGKLCTNISVRVAHILPGGQSGYKVFATHVIPPHFGKLKRQGLCSPLGLYLFVAPGG